VTETEYVAVVGYPLADTKSRRGKTMMLRPAGTAPCADAAVTASAPTVAARTPAARAIGARRGAPRAGAAV